MKDPNKALRLKTLRLWEDHLQLWTLAHPLNSIEDIMTAFKEFKVEGEPFFSDEQFPNIRWMAETISRFQDMTYDEVALMEGQMRVALRYPAHADLDDMIRVMRR